MKQFSLLILVIIIFFSCKKEYEPRNITSLRIKEFKMDSTSIRAIQIVNDKTVYYAGSRGDIGFTNDNGKSWSTEYLIYKDSILPNFRSIATNGKYFFALSIANPALLYKISNDTTEIVYKEEHKKVFYDSMKFFSDAKYGIAVGDPIKNCASIILTSDGGNTWNKIPCNKLPFFEDGEAFFAASNTNIKIIDDTVWIASGGKKARILKSIDKGQNWSVFETPIVQGDGPQGIYSIDFYDKKNGIIIGGDYSKPSKNIANKAITSDGGKTWTLIANGQNPAYKSCLQYVPNTNGKEIFAVGKQGISFSNDGGNSWSTISTDSYYTIQFLNKNTAWLAGNNRISKLNLQ